jgi:SAM-dependent methyltransferase
MQINPDFNDSFSSLAFNPFYIMRTGLLKSVQYFAPQLSGKLLDYGCGAKPYQSLFTVEKYVGIDTQKSGHDHSNEQIDVFFDGQKIPLDNSSFDCVFTSEVFEHIFEPDMALKEIHRVLKSKGKLLITTPFCWNEHEVPYDYARYSGFGLKYLLEKNGFKVLQQKKIGHPLSVIIQLYLIWVESFFHQRGPRGRKILALLLVFPMNLLHLLINKFKSQNRSESLYLSNVVFAEKAD